MATEPNPADLPALRRQIDQLDLDILATLSRRAALAEEVGRVKSSTGGEVFSASREEVVLGNVLGANRGPLGAATLKAIFRELISGCRALQKVNRVAFLGPEYSYSHLAALERFGESVEFLKVSSIPAVFEEVARKHVEYGLVPLENSTDGRIADTLDCFVRMPAVKICSEVRLRVHHNLLANVEPQSIRRIYSKAQALGQCRHWLSKNMPHASLHEVSSTADAARLVSTEPHAAAVASRQAAVRYGMGVVFSNIEDQPDNETRFAVVALHDSGPCGAAGSDKTAMVFRVPHTPGSLADVLAVFKATGINLTWIESFPVPGRQGEYVFFVDFDGHQSEPSVANALTQLNRVCESVQVLGSFPHAKPRAED